MSHTRPPEGRTTRLGKDEFAGQHVIIAGWGVSGRSAALVLHELGATISVLDGNPKADTSALPTGTQFIASEDPRELADNCAHLRSHLLIASPGWPAHHPVLAGWKGPVWSEVELAWHIADPATHWLTLTGTNGKTTTVGMVTAILRAADRTVREVGNVGVPIAQTLLEEHVAGIRLDNLAVEMSSFQLHHTYSVSATASAVLNLGDDHIDWHGSLREYVGAKGRIFERTQLACVFNADVPRTRSLVEAADVLDGARGVGFTLSMPTIGQLGVVEQFLVDRAFNANRRTHGQVVAELPALTHLAGPGGLAPHMVSNALAAAALTRADGVDPESVETGLRQYQAADHRMQRAATVDGVHFVNDSKATNAHAAAAALSAMDDGRVVWILGGLAKGAQFDELVATHVKKLRAAVVIGIDPEPFESAITRHAPQIPREIIDPGHDDVMSAAIRAAHALAIPGDTVLLAPAGASMDQFRSYEARGAAFIHSVESLAHERGSDGGANPSMGNGTSHGNSQP